MAKNTVIKMGQTFRRQLVLTYVDDGSPVNLTGCAAYCQMRKAPGGDLAATASCSLDMALGRITATFAPADTAGLEAGGYGYDIWIVSEGDKIPLYTEQVTVVKGYTENMA
jgi:hypothetical protein